MAIRKVRKIGDPVLRETSNNVEKIDKPVLDLVSDMLDTLEEEGGVGLAAPQIGITKRIILVRYEDKVETYINPEIEIIENKRIEGDEGCLSIYSIQGFQVKRYPRIKIRTTNIKGNTEEFIAEIVQFCEKKGLYLIMDDIYHRLIFDGKQPINCYKYAKKTGENSKLIVINGVSKQYAMTGFRIGWAVANKLS